MVSVQVGSASEGGQHNLLKVKTVNQPSQILDTLEIELDVLENSLEKRDLWNTGL